MENFLQLYLWSIFLEMAVPSLKGSNPTLVPAAVIAAIPPTKATRGPGLMPAVYFTAAVAAVPAAVPTPTLEPTLVAAA